MSAIIYCRVSSKQQDNLQNGNISLDVQENECRNYCKSNNIKISEVVREICSGTNMKQQILLQNILKNESNKKLIFYNISRFSRNVKDAIDFIQKLKKNNVNVYSVKEKCGYETSEEIHLFQITLSSSENETRRLSERLKKSKEFRKKNGGYIGGRAPYGYDVYRNTNGIRTLKINKKEKNIINEITSLKFDHQMTSKEITTYLNKNKKSYRGKNWNTRSINYVIRKNNINKLFNNLNI